MSNPNRVNGGNNTSQNNVWFSDEEEQGSDGGLYGKLTRNSTVKRVFGYTAAAFLAITCFALTNKINKKGTPSTDDGSRPVAGDTLKSGNGFTNSGEAKEREWLEMENGVRYASDAYSRERREFTDDNGIYHEGNYNFTNEIREAWGKSKEEMKRAIQESIEADPVLLAVKILQMPDAVKGKFAGLGYQELKDMLFGEKGGEVQEAMLDIYSSASENSDFSYVTINADNPLVKYVTTYEQFKPNGDPSGSTAVIPTDSAGSNLVGADVVVQVFYGENGKLVGSTYNKKNCYNAIIIIPKANDIPTTDVPIDDGDNTITPSETETTEVPNTTVRNDEDSGDKKPVLPSMTEWGKSGDSNAGSSDVQQSLKTEGDSGKKRIESNPGYIQDRAVPGSASDSDVLDAGITGKSNESGGYAESDIVAPGAEKNKNEGRLPGGEDQSGYGDNSDGSDVLNGESVVNSDDAAKGVEEDNKGNEDQAGAQGGIGGVAPGKDKLSDGEEEDNVKKGNF